MISENDELKIIGKVIDLENEKNNLLVIELLKNQESVIDKWYNFYSDKEFNISEVDKILLDDLNTPGFISKIHELYNEASKGNEKKKIQFNQACKLIGLFSMNKKEWESLKKGKINISESYITKKIEERSKAKKDGNFTLADKIRLELSSKGILIEDQKDKTIWKVK